jgi:hypothetical protein
VLGRDKAIIGLLLFLFIRSLIARGSDVTAPERVPFLRNRNTSTVLCLAHVLVGEPVSTSPQYLGERGRAQSVKTHFVEHRHRRLYDR